MSTLSSGVKHKSAPIFEQIAGHDHEQVVFCFDKNSGLKCIIAIHNTVLGPALGGTRFWDYKSEEDAITDVLRLSRGMTYKAAVSGLNLGGGKAVIIGDSRKDKTEALFRRYGKFISSLGGKYITAEDVGTNTRDMQYVALETDYVTGVPEYEGGGGDPSPITAYGTFLGIKASAKEAFGKDTLSGKKAIVQGVGHVGEHLVKYLTEAGAKVFISDIFEDRVNEIAKKYKATPVDVEMEYELEVDIYSPCALGASLNTNTISKLKCAIVAGSANNQLEDEEIHGKMLQERGIIYAPDFVINAGGLINVASELHGYNREKVNSDVEKIYERVLDIYKIAGEKEITTQQAAMVMAEKRIRDIASVNSKL